MSIEKGTQSYIVDPVHVLSYDSRKDDGTLPVVRVGNFTSIARNCTFLLSHHDITRVTTSPSRQQHLWAHGRGNRSSFSKGDIIVGNDVWIGANCTILDNVTIGDGAVVAAGAVVTRNVQPYAIVGGNPAKLIRKRFNDTTVARLQRTKWWNRPVEDLERLGAWGTDIDAFLHALETDT